MRQQENNNHQLENNIGCFASPMNIELPEIKVINLEEPPYFKQKPEL